MKTYKLKRERIILTEYDSTAMFPWPKNPQLTVVGDDDDHTYITLNKRDVEELINVLTGILQSFPSEL